MFFFFFFRFFHIQSDGAPAKGASGDPNQPRIDALSVINVAAPTKSSAPLPISEAVEANGAVNLGVGLGESELEELLEVAGGEPR